MCIVFGDGKGLPEDKYELYERVGDTVLHNRIADRVRRQNVRARLAVVAHGMHTGDGLGEERATPQAEVRDAEIDRMLRAYRLQSEWTDADERSIREAREELVTETGLLLQRGEHHAAFLHLSVQEFLAAQRLADVEGDRLRDVFVQRSRAPEWRNTLSFLFGSVLYTSTTPERAVRLLTDLVGRLKSDDVGLTLVTADAAEMLQRRGLRLAPPVAEALRRACEEAMRGNAPPRERAQAGMALGRIGDHRFRADRWFLPDDPMLGFVEIPTGPFTMGSPLTKDVDEDEAPQHKVTLSTYFIGGWPVTVAQFRVFVEDDVGNDGFQPGDPDCLRGGPSHPVTNVSLYEALAYCRWLTAKLLVAEDLSAPLRDRLRGVVSPSYGVALPSEAEWEKAARGADPRVYPWEGKTITVDHANYAATEIDGPSAVGCFAAGRSPFGVEEMSGNVCEWTRSPWTASNGMVMGYPYVPDYDSVGREDFSVADRRPRVVRGGAFNSVPRSVRVAYRLWRDPEYRNWDLGFRVVVSPFSSDL